MKRRFFLLVAMAAVLLATSVQGADIKNLKRGRSSVTADLVLSHKDVRAIEVAKDLPISLPEPLDNVLSALQKCLKKEAARLTAEDKGDGVVVSFKAFLVIGIPPKPTVEILNVQSR